MKINTRYIQHLLSTEIKEKYIHEENFGKKQKC